MRAATYARVSTEAQRDGISLDAQREQCRQFIRSRDWKIIAEYSDVQTGTSAARPELERLRARLSMYDAVVFWKLDRLSRSVLDLCQLTRECTQRDCALVSATEPFDTSSPAGRMMVHLLGSFAEFESATIGQRVRAANERHLQTGKLPWRATYGFRRRKEDGTALLHEEEAAVVQRVFEERAEGQLHKEIAAGLRHDGLERRRGHWTPDAVRDTLRQRAYLGELVVGRYVWRNGRWMNTPRSEWHSVSGILPQIISQDLWHRAHPHMRGNSPAKASLFRRLLRCAYCEHALHWYSDQRRYICDGRRRYKVCTVSQVAEGEIYAAFEEELDVLSEDDAHCEVERHGECGDEAAFEAAQARSSRAWIAFVEGGIEIEQVREAQQALDAENAALQMACCLPMTGEALVQALAACREALVMRDVAAGNMRLRAVVAKLVVHRQPTRVDVVLWEREGAR